MDANTIVDVIMFFVHLIFVVLAVGTTFIGLFLVNISYRFTTQKTKNDMKQEKSFLNIWYRRVGVILMLFWSGAFFVFSLNTLSTLPFYMPLLYFVLVYLLLRWKNGQILRVMKQSAVNFAHHQR